MRHLVERDILLQLTLTTLVCGVAQNNSVHKMYHTVNLLDNLGFTVCDKKSQEITFVSFILNSADKTVRLPLEKEKERVYFKIVPK